MTKKTKTSSQFPFWQRVTFGVLLTAIVILAAAWENMRVVAIWGNSSLEKRVEALEAKHE